MSTRSLVFVGSSIIAQWETLADFFPGLPLINTAVSGAQTPDLLARLEELVTAHAPRLVCYYCGSNDLNYAVPVAAIVANIVETHTRLSAQLPGLKFIYLSIIKAPQKADRWESVDAVNARMQQRAAEVAGFDYLDVNAVFFTQAGLPRAEYYQEDQLHLTPAAYAALGRHIAPQVLARWDAPA